MCDSIPFPVHSTTNRSSSSGIGSLRENATSAASSNYCTRHGSSSPPAHCITTSTLPAEELYRHSLHCDGYAAQAQDSATSGKNRNGFVGEPGLEGYVEMTGWEEWKIPGHEITLGAVLSHSQLETVYR